MVEGWQFDFSEYDDLSDKPRDNICNIVESTLKKFHMAESIYIDTSTIGEIGDGLTDKYMTAHKLALISINGMALYNITNNLADNWPDLQFICFFQATIDGLPSNALSKLTKLKVFDIRSSHIWVVSGDDVSSSNYSSSIDLQFLCDLDSLVSLELGQNGHVELHHCVDARIIEKKHLRGITAIISGFGIDNFNSCDFESYVIDLDRRYYLQSTAVCFEFKLRGVLLEENYPQIYKLLNTTGPCEWVCQEYYNPIVYSCRPYKWHHGICDEGCNNKRCFYDGGNCAQLCNFDECDYTTLGTRTCDDGCNNTNCQFDYCDCDVSTEDNICDFDFYECCAVTFLMDNNDSTTSYEYTDDNINIFGSWINDETCDESGAYNCFTVWS